MSNKRAEFDRTPTAAIKENLKNPSENPQNKAKLPLFEAREGTLWIGKDKSAVWLPPKRPKISLVSAIKVFYISAGFGATFSPFPDFKNCCFSARGSFWWSLESFLILEFI